MSGDLREMMHGAAEAKRRLFAGEDFAGGYGRSVVVRVRRRRAVSATAMGGGTVVAVGALAAGALNVPWGKFVFGMPPAGSPSVICTTTTPDAVVATGTYAAEPSGLVTFPKDFAGEVPTGRDSWVLPTFEGDSQYVLVVDNGDGLTATFASGEVLPLEPNIDGSYSFASHLDGHYVIWVSGSNLVVRSDGLGPDSTVPSTVPSAGPSSAPSPTVDCITPSPEPSDSPTPTASATGIAPTPTPTPTAADGVDSPFQCGFEFVSDEYGTDQLRVFGAPVADSAAVLKQLTLWNGGGGVLAEANDPAFTAYHAELDPADIDGAPWLGDPATDTRFLSLGEHSLGLSFVAVRDGVVVGTVNAGADGQAQGVAIGRDGDGPLEGLLWDRDALTPCGTSSVDGAQIYAVAGYGGYGQVLYSWKDVSE